MSLCIEVQVNSSSPTQQADLQRRIIEQVQGMGLSVDTAEFTPSHATLDELSAVPAGRAAVRVYQN